MSDTTDRCEPVSASASNGLRDGEVAIDLPTAFDAGVYFIGRVRTPWRCREDCPKNAKEARERGVACTIEVDEHFVPALAGIETCSHIIVLYWMDKARRDLALQRPRHYDEARGTFSLRSPVRPNPIALSVVPLVSREGGVLTVMGLDCLDGTPLVDLKPYFASTDAVGEAEVGWHTSRKT